MRHQRIPYVSRERYLIAAARNRSVLHLGFVGDRTLAPGEQTLHDRLTDVAAELWGVDLDAGAVSDFNARHPDVAHRTMVGDATDLQALPLRAQFDLIIAGDLIEHLVSPRTLLDSCRPVLGPQGRLIITTPNALGLLNVLRAWRGREYVNPRHVLWYSMSTFSEFCRQTGWVVESYATAYDFEPARAATRLKYRIGAAFFRHFPQWGGTLIFVVRPDDPDRRREEP